MNFNDFASGLGLLFSVLHVSVMNGNAVFVSNNVYLFKVNNMHVISSGFEATMNDSYSRVLIFGWYCVSVLLLLNVIPAFVLVTESLSHYLDCLSVYNFVYVIAQFLELLCGVRRGG